MAVMANAAQIDDTPTDHAGVSDKLRGAAAIGAHLGIPSRTAQRLLKSGHIPGFQIGSTWVAFRATLDAWLDELNDGALKRSFLASGFHG